MKSTGNMYQFVTETRNFIGGRCPHKCHYCYVKDLKRFPALKKKYSGKPRLIENEFNKSLGKNKFIFIGSCIDMFAEDIPEDWILRVLEYCRKFDNKYLFQSKNPGRMTTEFIKYFPRKTVLGCYDIKARVLTPNGFKKYNEIKEGDEVFTINPTTEEIEIEKIKEIFIYFYTGKMIQIKGERIDLLVTPNHKLWGIKQGEDKYNFILPYNLTKTTRFKITADWNGELNNCFILPAYTSDHYFYKRYFPELKIPMHLWLELLGYYLSEGSCRRRGPRRTFRPRLRPRSRSPWDLQCARRQSAGYHGWRGPGSGPSPPP